MEQVVIVTGAASGIGAATVDALAARGSTLALVDRDEGALRGLRSRVPKAMLLAVDIADSEAVEEAFASVVGTHGRIDGLVHSAAIDAQASVKQRLAEHVASVTSGRDPYDDFTLHIDDDLWYELMRVNLDGAFFCLRAALRHMLPARSGSIVMVASQAGISGIAGLSHYAASKGGVLALVRSVAKEVAAAGIRVNAVAPGSVQTPMWKRSPVVLRETGPKMSPIGRSGAAGEIASVISFLLSEQASYVIGETVNVNGGSLTI